MEQPEGFEEEGKEDYVWRVQKGIYGMHQAGRIWNKGMHNKMMLWGFSRLDGSIVSMCARLKTGSVASPAEENERIKAQLKSEWTIAEGDANFCLGIEIERDRENKFVHIFPKAMIDRIVKQFGQQEAYPASTPMVADNTNTFLTRPPSDEVLSVATIVLSNFLTAH